MTFDSALPSDLLDLKNQFESWRSTRSKRAPIPDDLLLAAKALLSRYPSSTICRALRLNPRSLKDPLSSPSSKKSASSKSKADFFPLPNPSSHPQTFAPGQNPSSFRLLLERPDGSRLTLTLPSIDTASISNLCSNFLRS